ncbi:hypothetical protein [Vibrio penaeicida]|uniref:Lipoprotein n=1 Tax=Vibrio penaeicida TaxID=104609 RepID=A0AAV5NXE8_9VIBR|nr:hypothetical protein [Vibrio penaeicida]RTZ24834.1 hypothetical protein EKN09_01560 [Vibrio penaeicida]GLQ74984.1 hypothetical protein GCM10007932_43460 [Vibrio penaeicida]
MNKLTSCAALVSSIVLVSGCQTTKLADPVGNGAALVPVVVYMSNTVKYPCHAISFAFGDDSRRFYTNLEELKELEDGDYSQYGGYGLLTDIPPGDYSITEARCHMQPGYLINGTSTYMAFPITLDVTITPNTVQLVNGGILGHGATDTRSRFDVKWYDWGDEGGQFALNMFLQQADLPDGWTIAK